MTVKKDIRFRVYVAFTCICILGIAILIKAFLVQVKEGPELRQVAQSMHTRTAVLPAERGDIFAANGELLCSTIPEFDAHVDFGVIKKELFDDSVKVLAQKLSKLFGDASVRSYEAKLRNAHKKQLRYWRLQRNMSYEQYQALRTFPVFNKGKNYGGLIIEPKAKRVNPHGMLAYRTVGLWRDGNAVGLEATYDSVLSGVQGRRIEQKVIGGLWMPLEGSEIEPQNGKDIVTTIDIGMQDIAENTLKSVLKEHDCQYGTCIVMEVETGKVRALANLGRQKNGSYWEDMNYALVPTEPGSTFKLVTLLALLNDKYINIDDIIDAEGGAIKFGGLTMRDSHLGLRKMTIRDAFAHSSNAAMAKLAVQYYYKDPMQFVKHLQNLKLDKRTGIDLLGERRPLVKTPDSKTWSKTTLPWMSTGYEVMITPMHTCMLYNAIANNGKMMKPYLVSEVREYGKTIAKYEPQVLVESVGDASAVKQLQACVEEVALSGTAQGIASPFYTIAGKTGTAQVADKGIKYSDGVYQGSFVGYFPADKPRYTIAVVVRTKPHSRSYYGSTVAAPVFRMIADKIFANNKDWDAPLDSISKSADRVMVASKAKAGQYKNALGFLNMDINVADADMVAQLQTDSFKRMVLVADTTVAVNKVPDVVGMGLKDAVYMLEQQGLRVHIEGKGKIVAQSIVPGNEIRKGRVIVLRLG